MRYWYCGNSAAVVDVDGVDGENDIAQLAGSLPVTFWNLQVGGTQYIDLLDLTGTEVTESSTSTGSDGWGLGIILPVQLPDGVGEAYASVNGGPRFKVSPTNLGPLLDALQTAFQQHVASLNGHSTGFGNLVDVSAAAPAERTDGHVPQWSSALQLFQLAAPAAVAGAVMLDPPEVAGEYVGNVAAFPGTDSDLPPWLKSQAPHSGGDDNPDFLVLYSTSATDNQIKVFWFNGNMEPRCAPSLNNRVALRVFEMAQGLAGPSTQRVFEVSTNPTNTLLREPILGVYGTGHSTQPGWTVATRVLAGLLGVRPGGSYNSLTAYTFRGQKTGTGAPSTGAWLVGDVVMDSAGALHLCTVAGTPGTWSSPAPPATSFTAVGTGTNISLGTVQCATRLEAGGSSARMRGTLVAGAAISANAVIGTVTAAHWPLHTVTTNARTTGGGARLRINTDGTIQYGSALANADEVWLDNITWDLAA